MGWIAFDLDATLAEWGEGTSNPGDISRIGTPILPMVMRLRHLVLTEGYDVRLFTARVGPATDDECYRNSQGECICLADWVAWQTRMIDAWMVEHVGFTLPITATKDWHMYQLYDDRCKQVIPNSGETVEERLQRIIGRLEQLQERIVDPALGEET